MSWPATSSQSDLDLDFGRDLDLDSVVDRLQGTAVGDHQGEAVDDQIRDDPDLDRDAGTAAEHRTAPDDSAGSSWAREA